jgi:cobalt-zinc-cadmium efflux system outer membrane protein
MRRFVFLLLAATIAHPRAFGQPPARIAEPVVHVARASHATVATQAEPIGPGAAARLPQPLTLADLEGWALRNNPTIASAEALIREQQGIWRQSGLYPNPTAGYVRTDPNQSRQSETQGLFLSQEFVTAKKLQLAQAADRQDIEWRRWQLDAQRRRVVNDVRIRFYEVLGAQRAIRETMNMEQLAAEGVRAVQRMIEVQQATRPDLLQAEMQLHAFRIALADARYRHTTAWRQLANVAGVPRLPPTDLVGDLEHIPRLDWETSLQRLLTKNPVLRSQRSYIQAARIDVRLARAQAVPNLNVQMVLQHDQVMKYNQVSTLAALPFPVFNRNQGNIDFAAAELRHQQQEYQRIELALQDQLAGAFNEYLSARNHAEVFQRELLPRAKESLDLTLRGQKLGEFDFARVLNARQQSFQTTLAYVDALTAMHKVAIEVEGMELTGGLNPTEIGTALQRQAGGTAATRNVLLQQLQQQGLQGSQMLPGAIQGATR